MPQDYEQGKEIGQLQADIQNLIRVIEEHNNKQDKWNGAIEQRVRLLETWVSSTTGKVVVLTAIFSIVGTATYIVINWFLNYKFK